MKRKTFFKLILFTIPLISLLAGCSNNNSGAGTTGTTAAAVGTTTFGNTGTTTTTTTTTSSSCSHQITTKPLYNYPTVEGSGTGSTQTPYNAITGADQDLQVQITPGGSGASQGGGGSYAYYLMSMDVILLSNGSPVSGATIHVPQSGQSYYGGANTGLPVGQSQVINFSSYLIGGNGNYSIKIQNVQTDYECRNICLGNYYCGYEYGEYYCDQQMIETCMQKQCDVGPAQSNSSWSAGVEVETDTTPCLPGTTT